MGRATIGIVLLLSAVVLLTVIAPLLAILATAITRAPGVPLTWETATLDHFYTVYTGIPKVGRALTNSLGLAVAAATTVARIGCGDFDILTVRLRVRGRTWLDALIDAAVM
ncbi:iron ABC transporter permease, partial [bacterium]|nr:iron ABC transporter permease [bacterium]